MPDRTLDLVSDRDLDPADRRLINELSDRIYPPGPLRDWLASIEWAPSTSRVLVRVDGRLVCHASSLIRSARLDDETVTIGGLAGVMTAPDARHGGHARAAIDAMHRHLVAEHAQFLLLFCAKDMHDFYRGLGWQLFDGTPLVEQHGKSVAFGVSLAMVKDGTAVAPAGGKLDICGPPW